MRNAMMIDSRDDVAVAIETIKAGETITYVLDGQEKSLTARQDITIYHKLAIHDIAKGAPVSKYGEHIGVAARDIKAGEHVHTENVADHRENLDV
ncbi:Altronate dehydratase [bioreactor metagenome]|uniref:Altronate dehydratase n=1 Tax=bioreactor metagenome TaxID=1076179 RepID=A0A645DCZ8_9ZZZZ